jgi:uncharacterized membrane protein
MTLLFLAYPYLAYLGMQHGIVWFAPMLISFVYLNQAFKASRLRIKLIKLGISLGLIIGAIFFQALTAKLLPILIQLMLMHFFGRTLVHGPTLIERFVRMEFPQFPPGIVEYCRQLTWVWTGFFAFNALMCAALAIWASDSVWALYNGVFIYVLTGLVMVGEYIWRHFHFPQLDIPAPKTSVRNLINHGRIIWKDVNA